MKKTIILRILTITYLRSPIEIIWVPLVRWSKHMDDWRLLIEGYKVPLRYWALNTSEDWPVAYRNVSTIQKYITSQLLAWLCTNSHLSIYSESNVFTSEKMNLKPLQQILLRFFFIWSCIDVLFFKNNYANHSVYNRYIKKLMSSYGYKQEIVLFPLGDNEITPEDEKFTRCKQNDYSSNQGIHSWHEKEALNTEYLNRLKFNHTRNLNS